LAYVDDSTSEEMAAQKGTPTQPGTNSPYRTRSTEENLTLFADMKAGKYPDGSKVLRAKIDMTHTNMLMRDPVIYRIKHAHHHRTGDAWCIYPMYDFAHGQSDSIEKITHSICTLEFVPHRELYNWCIDNLEIYPSRQSEFARLNMTYTMMSKRKLLQLVTEKHVTGWDDPRMPTLSGVRRRGYTPEAIRDFCDRIGVAKRDNLIDISLLEFCVREHLNKVAARRMVVFDPLKVVITNYPEGKTEIMTSENYPEDHTQVREMPFGRELYIEREDFMEVPVKKYFRLSPGQMVRLKSGFIIKCDDFIKDANGNVMELRCSYIPESRSGSDTSGINVKGVIHWVNVQTTVPVEVRLYDRLFNIEDMGALDDDFRNHLNPDSLKVLPTVYAEPEITKAKLGEHFQFLRMGYFCLDTDSTSGKLIFNRTSTLRDMWAKEVKK
jgi:glutaminyl-tRNA synthetase